MVRFGCPKHQKVYQGHKKVPCEFRTRPQPTRKFNTTFSTTPTHKAPELEASQQSQKNKINTAMPGSLIASKILTRTWHIKSSPAREALNKYYSFNFKSEIQHKWSNATIDYSKIQSAKKKHGLPPPFPQTIVKCYFSDFHPERREQSEGHLPEHTGNTMGITMQKLGHPISPT